MTKFMDISILQKIILSQQNKKINANIISAVSHFQRCLLVHSSRQIRKYLLPSQEAIRTQIYITFRKDVCKPITKNSLFS